MPVDVESLLEGKLVVVKLSGKLESADYAHFAPIVEDSVTRFGKIRMAVLMRDFHGWDSGALWEDLKFDAKHFRDIERLAMVGDRAWEKGMAAFCKPFTTASVRYFDVADEAAAMAWLQEG